MKLTILNMNFNQRTISFEIDSYPSDQQERLRGFLAYCASLRFTKFSLFCSRRLTNSQLTSLTQLSDTYDLTIQTKKSSKNNKAGDSTRFHRVVEPSAVEYAIACTDFDHLRPAVKQFALVVGKSIPLDERLISRLRLCIYELAVNSLEHAKYSVAVPQIDVSIRIEKDRLTVLYKDNAALFRTKHEGNVSVKEQIMARRTRGLGLFMIKSMSDAVSFERKGEWNCTTLVLERHEFVS